MRIQQLERLGIELVVLRDVRGEGLASPPNASSARPPGPSAGPRRLRRGDAQVAPRERRATALALERPDERVLLPQICWPPSRWPTGTGATWYAPPATILEACVEINLCVGCTDNSSALNVYSDDARPSGLVERQGTGIATPSSRRRVDGVEDDADSAELRAVNFCYR